jgi:formylmethanofuran dehydrogenase subunit E-like metal-binding protein
VEGLKIEKKLISDDMLEGVSKIAKQSAHIHYGRLQMALFDTAQRNGRKRFFAKKGPL